MSRNVMSQKRRRRAAFTVVELLVVIAIIAVIATLAYPRVNFTQFQVDAGARVIRIAMQNAERLAVTRQYDVIVGFDATGTRLRVLEDNNNNNQADPGERITWLNLEDSVHLQQPPGSGINGPVGAAVVGTNLKLVDGMQSVIFRRDGAASTDLEIYLTSRRAKPDDFRAIQVVQSTGRTDWFRYLNATWKQGSL